MSSRPNPFDFSNPVTDPSVLAGRAAEMKQASYYLDQSGEGASYSLALIGDRASGKTSLLNGLSDYASDTGLIAAGIRLNERMLENDLNFFREVFYSLMKASAARGLWGGEAGAEFDTFCRQVLHHDLDTDRREEPLAFGRVYAKAQGEAKATELSSLMLLSDIEVIVERCRGEGFPGAVLLIDEGDVLSGNHGLLQTLRNLLMDSKHFAMIIAGTEQMFPSISDVFSPVPRQFVRINVGPFRTWRDTQKAILSRLLLAGQEWAMPGLDECREIHSLTRGRPYEVMLVSHFAYRERTQAHNRLPMSVTPTVMEAVAGQLEQQNPAVQETKAKLRKLDQADAKAIRELMDFDGFSIDRFAFARMDFTRPFDKVAFEEARAEVLKIVERLAWTEFVSAVDGRVRVEADSFQRALIKYEVLGRPEDDDDEVEELPLGDPAYRTADKCVDAISGTLVATLAPHESAGMMADALDAPINIRLALDEAAEDYSVQAVCTINAGEDWLGVFAFRREADSEDFRTRVGNILLDEAGRLADFGVSISEISVESIDEKQLKDLRDSFLESAKGFQPVVAEARSAFSAGSSDFPGKVAKACAELLEADPASDDTRAEHLSDCAFMMLSTESPDGYEPLSDRLEALADVPLLSRATRALWAAVQGDYDDALVRLELDLAEIEPAVDEFENVLMYSPAVLAAEHPSIGYSDLVGGVSLEGIIEGYKLAIDACRHGRPVAEALGEGTNVPWRLGAAADAADAEGRPEFAKELRRKAAQTVEEPQGSDAD